jgi:hypothetical protein
MRQEAPFVVRDADPLEVVHAGAGDRHTNVRVAVEGEIRPERRARERDAVDADGLVFQNVDVRALRQGFCLFERPSQVGAVTLVIAHDVEDRPVRHALEKPADTALGAWDQVAGDNQDVEIRPRVSGRQVPAPRELEMDVGHDPEPHVSVPRRPDGRPGVRRG